MNISKLIALSFKFWCIDVNNKESNIVIDKEN